MNELVGKRLDEYIIVAVYEDMWYNGIVIGYKWEDNHETWATWYYVKNECELKFRHVGMTEKEAIADFLDRIKNLMVMG